MQLKNKRLKQNKGFTLVETTVSLLLFSVIAGLVCSMLIMGLNILSENAAYDMARTAGNSLFDTLSGKLSCAEAVEITKDGKTSTDITSKYNEQICIDGENVTLLRKDYSAAAQSIISSTALKGYSFNVSLEIPKAYEKTDSKQDISKHYLMLTVTVSLDGVTKYQSSGAVSILNYEDFTFVNSYSVNNESDGFYKIQGTDKMYISYSFLE